MLTVVRYITIMLCAIALALGLTQALATTPSPVLLTAVRALLSAAAASAMILSLLLRKRRGFGFAFWGTFVLAVAGVLWAVPQQVHSVFVALAAWLLGFSLVVVSAIRQPVVRRAPRGPLPLYGRTRT